MENRDKDKMSQGSDIKRDVPLDKNEPISRTGGSVGSSGMKGGSKLEKSSDLGSQDKWSDIDKQSGSE
jgi:hypothetical protein